MARQILSTANLFLCLLYVIQLLINNADRVNGCDTIKVSGLPTESIREGLYEKMKSINVCTGFIRSTYKLQGIFDAYVYYYESYAFNGWIIGSSLCTGTDIIVRSESSVHWPEFVSIWKQYLSGLWISAYTVNIKCTYDARPSTTTCSSSQYRCVDGECISWSYFCDGDRDCASGEDETLSLCRPNTTARSTDSTTYPDYNIVGELFRYGWYPWAGSGSAFLLLIVSCSCVCWCCRRKGSQPTTRTVSAVPPSIQVNAQTVSSQVHTHQNVTNPQPWPASNVPASMIHPPSYDASCATGITPSAIPLSVIHPSVPLTQNYYQGSAYPGPTTTGSLPVEYASQPPENPKL